MLKQTEVTGDVWVLKFEIIDFLLKSHTLTEKSSSPQARCYEFEVKLRELTVFAPLSNLLRIMPSSAFDR
jgi:hypothetical protein